MSTTLKRVLGWGLVIVMIAAVINDASRFFSAGQKADEVARLASIAGADATRTNRDRNIGWTAVYNTAASAGGVADNIDVQSDGVRVWVHVDMGGTWVVAPYTQVVKGNYDVVTWWSQPVPVRSERRSLY